MRAQARGDDSRGGTASSSAENESEDRSTEESAAEDSGGGPPPPPGGGPPPPPGGESNPGSGGPVGITVGRYATLIGVRPDVLSEIGLTDIHVDSKPTVRIPFFDESRNVASVRLLRNTAGDLEWRADSKPYPYGVWRLGDARTAGYVVLADSLAACHVFWSADIPAGGLIEEDGWPIELDAQLDGISNIYIPVDQSTTGQTGFPNVPQWIESSSLRDRIHLIPLPIAGRSLQEIGSIGSTLREIWEDIVGKATPWAASQKSHQDREAQEAFAIAQPLLEDPHILDRIKDIIRRSGYAGDTTPPFLAYIAVTSRLLKRPINVAFEGSSAAGKSFAVNVVLALFPPDAYHKVTASSPLAFIYLRGSFRHRSLFVGEADSIIVEEGPAASALRAIVADNEMIYETVDRNRKGELETRRIWKPGPTGLLTTLIGSLPPQMATRALEVTLVDDPHQTRRILLVQAAAASGKAPAPTHVELEPFIAVQRWLELAGERRGVIPFAEELACLVPATRLRMRRAFPQLLTAIETFALLRQCQRARDAEGRVVATLDDYAEAKLLLDPVFNAVAAGYATTWSQQLSTGSALPRSEERR